MRLCASFFSVVLIFAVMPSFSFSMQTEKSSDALSRLMKSRKWGRGGPSIEEQRQLSQESVFDSNQVLLEKQRRISEVSIAGSEQALSEVSSERSRSGSEDYAYSGGLLAAAAVQGNAEQVTTILKAQDDLSLPLVLNNNGRGISEKTPLMLAVMNNRVAVVQKILDRLANVAEPKTVIEILGAVTNEGDTVLHFAANYSDEKMVDLLLTKFDSLGIVQNGHKQNFSTLVALSKRDDEGLTPMHYAAREGKKGVIELFLERYRNNDPVGRCLAILRPDELGNTAFHFAVRGGHAEITKMFLDCFKKAKMLRNALEAKNQHNKTVRDEAAEYAVAKNSGWESLHAIDAAAAELRDEKWE